MKLTTLDAINILYIYVNGSSLMTGDAKPTGGLYKIKRPLNSDKEDFVINAITLNREAVQEGVLNFNIHVPNLSFKVGTSIDNTQPNFKRLKELCSAFSALVDDIWLDVTVNGEKCLCNFTIQQENPVPDESSDQYYQNFRVEFYSPTNN